MIFANTKERLLHYLDFKGVKVSQFFLETGIKRGFLDTDKLSGAVSDSHLAIIIATYNDISLDWLISEKGEMLRSLSPGTEILNEPEVSYHNHLVKELVRTKDATISILNREVSDLRGDINFLKLIIEKKLTEAS